MTEAERKLWIAENEAIRAEFDRCAAELKKRRAQEQIEDRQIAERIAYKAKLHDRFEEE